MSILAALFAAVTVWFAGPQSLPPKAEAAAIVAARPTVEAVVSISEQRMYLTVVDQMGFRKTITWKVSTGKAGFETPTGAWKPTWLSVDHKSATYDNAPMPFAVFFTGGYAVHATEFVGRLGEPASHGCIRLASENAA
ncbi:MAG: L,D-transpeptidase, partial [Bauldia sp.]|nr:L,D-transpeptidase [Bauldia sp.]